MIIRAITKSSHQCSLYFENGKLLKLTFDDEDCSQGISAWCSYWGINDLDIEEGEILGENIVNYHELPEIIKSHIEGLLGEVGSGSFFEWSSLLSRLPIFHFSIPKRRIYDYHIHIE